jgi:Uma2 family endonuclease
MMLAIPPTARSLGEVQHLVLEGVSWEFYEHLLREAGDEGIRVTYDEGSIEIMSPLPKHEKWIERIARLIDVMAYERDIVIECLGSTTFRKKQRRKGLEPDKCFYVRHAAEAREMEEAFDPAVNPPPDLAIEVDITRRSIPREPIYAALGVPELWRLDKSELVVRVLNGDEYVDSAASLSFPFLPMTEFQRYVLRMADEPVTQVLREFGVWVRGL